MSLYVGLPWIEDIDLEVLIRDTGIPKHLLEVNIEKLSMGQKQKVCIAHALTNRPEIPLLDEPTSYMDVKSSRKIEELLLNLCKEEDLTLFWITHELEQAMRIGGRRFVLKMGRLAEDYN